VREDATSSPARGTRALPEPTLRFREIGLIDLEPDKLSDAASLRRNSGISDSEKRVEHCVDTRAAVQFDGPLARLNRKCCRMRSFLCAAQDRFVRNEPRVATTTEIASSRMCPAS